VDLGKHEAAAASKKNRMLVDRSERSRRVLKMESMRNGAPRSRDEGDEEKSPTAQAPSQMFLPSENPTGRFIVINI